MLPRFLGGSVEDAHFPAAAKVPKGAGEELRRSAPAKDELPVTVDSVEVSAGGHSGPRLGTDGGLRPGELLATRE